MSEKQTPTESNRSRRTILKALGITTVGGFGMTGSAAAQGNPHFTEQATACLDDDGCVVVDYQVAGLGRNRTVTVTSTAEGSVLLQCINPRGNSPPGQRRPVTETAEGTPQTTTRSGNITGQQTVCLDEEDLGENPCPHDEPGNPNWTYEVIGDFEVESVTLAVYEGSGTGGQLLDEITITDLSEC